MKKLILSFLFLAPALSQAQSYYATPRFGGGYDYYGWDQRGNYTNGYATPRFGGGYDYYQWQNGSYSHDWATPRFGGGYDFHFGQ